MERYVIGGEGRRKRSEIGRGEEAKEKRRWMEPRQ